MAVKRVKKEALVSQTILFTAETDAEFEAISPSYGYNLIDIISLDGLNGSPVIPTTGSYNVFARTDKDGGFKLLTDNGSLDATKTGGSALADGVAVGASFIDFPLEFKIVPTGVDVAVAYRVHIRQSSVQLNKIPDDFIRSFETSEEGTTALGVFIQDQTTPNINLILDNNVNAVTLASDTALDSTTITLIGGHGVLVGESIVLQEGDNVSQFEVLIVVSDTITLDSPIDHIYTAAGTAGQRTTTNMSVVGTLASPVIFSIKPILGQRWDITRVIFVIESTANNMDFTGFGSISALTNGCVLRKKNGDRQNIFNWKSNGDIIHRAFDHEFEGKTGGGGSGFVVRTSFAGQGKQGVTIRLDGDINEEIQVLIQDDLSSMQLTKIFMIAQGHLVQD